MRIPRFPVPAATGTVTVRATPAETYRVISDPPVMITFAEEAHGARWLRGATAAAVGARFIGYNRNGLRRWFTICRITDADPGRRFAYEVTAPPGIPISRWQYDIEATAEGRTAATAVQPRIMSGRHRMASIAILTSLASSFLPRYSGVRPTMRPATNIAMTTKIRIP